jgi:UDP-N-acetylmuramoylalanine--D-glutamate ligase
MSAARKRKPAARDLVVGLGATGLSAARYLQRKGGQAVFADTRDEPPGRDELEQVWPDAEVLLGATDIPAKIGRVIVSPGVPDDVELLRAARRAKLPVVSDIELFAGEARAPFVAITGSNGKSTVTTLV